MEAPLNKPANIALSITDSMRIDKTKQYQGFVTVAVEIELAGKTYTVRRFFDETAFHGPDHSQILKDPNVKTQMLAMVEKMANIAVAFNLGRAKQKSGDVIEQIVLHRDQKITRYGKDGKEISTKQLDKILIPKHNKYDKIVAALNDPTTKTETVNAVRRPRDETRVDEKTIIDSRINKKEALSILLKLFPGLPVHEGKPPEAGGGAIDSYSPVDDTSKIMIEWLDKMINKHKEIIKKCNDETLDVRDVDSIKRDAEMHLRISHNRKDRGDSPAVAKKVAELGKVLEELLQELDKYKAAHPTEPPLGDIEVR